MSIDATISNELICCDITPPDMYSYFYFLLQITLKKFSLTALPSNGVYGMCIDEPDAQYVQGDTVVTRHEFIPINISGEMVFHE